MGDNDSKGGFDPSKMSDDELNKDSDYGLSDDELEILEDGTKEKINSLKKEPFIKKHFRDKYQKTLKEFDEYKIKNPEKEPDKKDNKPKGDDSDHRLTSIELRQLNNDLDDEDINKAIAIAKAESKNPREILSDSYFKHYLAKKKEEKEAADATPGNSFRSGQTLNNTFENAIKNNSLIKTMDSDTLVKFKAYCKQKGKE